MERTFFVPNAGGMPVLEELPTLLQKSITQLKKLSCVAGVISTRQHEGDASTTFLISFAHGVAMDYRQALQCFNVDGIAPKAYSLNFGQRSLVLKLAKSKSLLN